MTASARRWRGFTLIEIMMVVVILGVLATVIIGLFSNATGDAAGSALKDNLRGIRGALQVYYAQHGASVPDSLHIRCADDAIHGCLGALRRTP